MLDPEAPGWLWALLAIVPLALLAAWNLRESARHAAAFAPRGIWAKMRVGAGRTEIAMRASIGLAAVAMVALALADPGPPRSAGVQTQDQDGPRLLVLLDLSRSMLARDSYYGGRAPGEAHAGTRFDAARGLLRDLLALLGGWNVGVVVFAAEPQVLCPVTGDHAAVLTFLERARPDQAGLRPGSNLESALRAGATLLGKRRGSLLLVSDGEEHSGKAVAAAAALARQRIPLHVAGMGSTAPVPLILADGQAARWRGSPIMTARNDAFLGDLAHRTGGRYWPSRGVSGPGSAVTTPTGFDLARGLAQPAGRSRGGSGGRHLPVAIALALLAADAAWLARARLRSAGRALLGAWLGRPPGRPALARPVLAAALAAALAGWTWPAIPYVQRALDAYRQGDGTRSAQLLEQAARHDDSPEVRYDLGNAYHLAGNFAKSLAAYETALRKLPPRSRTARFTHYNAGNTRFRMGDYRGAAAAYRRALELDPADDDARHNLALAEERMAQQQRAAPGPGATSPRMPQSGAIPMPSSGEADALLARLEEDERRMQAEASRRDGQQDPSAESPSQLARRLLKEAEQSAVRQLEKDW